MERGVTTVGTFATHNVPETHMHMYRIIQHLHVDTIMYKDTDAGITTRDWTAPAITSRIMWNSRKWLSTLLAKNKYDRR